MLAFSMLKLLVLGVFSEIFQKNRLQKSWAVVVCMAAATVLFFMLTPEVMVDGKAFVYNWIDTNAIRVKLTVLPSLEMYKLGALLGLIALAMMFYNCFYDEGKMRLRNAGLYLLILVAMLALVSAQNMMQIMIALCWVDVLCFYLLKDSWLKRGYMFYNVLADMLFIIVVALIWGDQKSLSVEALSRYMHNGDNKQIVAMFWTLVVLLKTGMVLFHDFVINLKKISFVRGIYIFYAATPMAGLILLWKTSSVLESVDWTRMVIAAFAAGSMLWAFVGSLVIDNIKAKIMYWNMMLMGLMAALLSLSTKVFLDFVPWLPWCGIMLSAVMILPVVAASNELLVSKMGGFISRLKISFVASMLLVAAELQVILHYSNGTGKMWVWGFLLLQMLSVTSVWRQIYCGKTKADEKVWVLLKNPNLLYFVPVVLFGGLVFSYFGLPLKNVWLGLALVLMLIVANPLAKLEQIYAYDKIQKAAPCSFLFEVLLVFPVRILGRVLWLLIDFVFIERTIINTLRRLMAFLVKTVAILHVNMFVGAFIFTFIGGAILIWVYYFNGGL